MRLSDRTEPYTKKREFGLMETIFNTAKLKKNLS